MASIAYTNGTLRNGSRFQFVACWDVKVGEEVQQPEWVAVPDGQKLVVTEVLPDGNDPASES